MAWKQDLAKLKQQLGPEATAPVPKALPKPPPRPQGPVPLDDEDAIFLSAMGLKPASSRTARPVEAPSPEKVEAAAIPPPTPESFQDAIKELKGLKPLPSSLPQRAARPLPEAEMRTPGPKTVAVPEPVTEPETTQLPLIQPEPALAETIAAAACITPVRFQLAAGMAIEVDGSLDLRGHSLNDALERLKDRLGDGMVLGWRTLQVSLGTDPALHEGLLTLLASGEVPMVARFAQAPVPMGGTQAWLLYFGPSPTQS